MVPLVLFLLGCSYAFPQATQLQPVDNYATKYDHIDVEAILNNRRMVIHYTACLLSKGPCSPDGLQFKSKIAYFLCMVDIALKGH